MQDSKSLPLVVEPREVYVKAYLSGSDSPSNKGSDFEEIQPEYPPIREHISLLNQESLMVFKAVRFMKSGDDKSCVTALAVISNYDWNNLVNLNALSENGGLEMLVNLLETNSLKCRLAALRVFCKVTKHPVMVHNSVCLGLAPVLVERLQERSCAVQEAAATVISQIGYKRRASKAIRRCRGIQCLMHLLRVDVSVLIASPESLAEHESMDIRVSRSALFALWTLSRFSKNKTVMMQSGSIIYMSRLLLSGNKMVSYPAIGLIAECSSDPAFQLAIETEGLVGTLIYYLNNSTNTKIHRLSALALMRAASGSDIVRDMMRFHNGMHTLIKLLKRVDHKNFSLVTALIGAVWKSSITEKNVLLYEKLGVIPILVDFINSPSPEVTTAAVGGLAEMAKVPSCREDIICVDAVPMLSYLLTRFNKDLLANTAQLVGEIAKDPQGMLALKKGEGVPLVWSLLKNQDRNVRIQGLWAVKLYVRSVHDRGEMIRSMMGSVVLLMNMLKEKDVEVLAGVCAVIAEVALDSESMAVMTEHGVLKLLGRLVTVKDVFLRRNLAEAITNCCSTKKSAVVFGRMGIIPVLGTYLDTKDQELIAHTCAALHALSSNKVNCVELHGCGLVPFLLAAVDSRNPTIQMHAALCLANIRRELYISDVAMAERKIKKIRLLQPL